MSSSLTDRDHNKPVIRVTGFVTADFKVKLRGSDFIKDPSYGIMRASKLSPRAASITMLIRINLMYHSKAKD
ncbi:hypothetical protein NPIL_314641 [Nephila pilipes]|uniref:Uncharacterized protein n=1 Tax=Nephila pilipes TaxID=299642 RepID=A0A8X6PHH5_NEPPI|nr:hypothetical protein NPIL_314641 [Nephila pilipes]